MATTEQMQTIHTNIHVTDDNDRITLAIETSAAAAGIDLSTDGSALDDTPIRLVLDVVLDSEGRTHCRYTLMAWGLHLRDALAGCAPTFIPVPNEAETVRAALDRIAPAWRGWEIDAEVQLRSEVDLDGDAWLEALNERAANVFGVGI